MSPAPDEFGLSCRRIDGCRRLLFVTDRLPDVAPLIAELAEGIRRALAQQNRRDPVMVGIRTGGVWIATHLHAMLQLGSPLGTLNINFYRDDFTRIGMHPRVMPSNVPFDVQDRHIVLIDDVLHTGRTIRAALNEIFDYGRPASVTLGVLVERSGRSSRFRLMSQRGVSIWARIST